MIIGIDPGLTGGIAFKYADGEFDVHDMPVAAKLFGKGNQVDEDALVALMELAIISDGILLAVVEQVSAMPPIKGKVRVAGTVSSFNFGQGFGVIRGILAGLGIKRQYIIPAIWKKHFGLIGKEKDAARTKARELFPKTVHLLNRKKDIGRADAILIAEYGFRTL
mgnify:CR=1 FL=1